MEPEKKIESFEEFKKSFSYGDRSDLNFKFLKSLPDLEAAEFVQALFDATGDALLDGDSSRLHDLIFQWQKRAYSGPGRHIYEESPFTPLPDSLGQLNVALISSSGHFMKDDDPEPFGVKNMTQKEAEERIKEFILSEPQLSEIPADTDSAELKARHGGYDTRASNLDPNVNFPIARMREMAAEGKIGAFASPAYSFVGACSQKRLQNRTAPRWIKLFQSRSIQAMLLVPV